MLDAGLTAAIEFDNLEPTDVSRQAARGELREWRRGICHDIVTTLQVFTACSLLCHCNPSVLRVVGRSVGRIMTIMMRTTLVT
jgi:hypothetical protein